jgi:hypothetical protein
MARLRHSNVPYAVFFDDPDRIKIEVGAPLARQGTR